MGLTNSPTRSGPPGLFPINHTVVVRRSLLESHPWIALNLYSAFVAAKEEIARAGKSYLQWYFESGLLDGGVKRIRILDSTDLHARHRIDPVLVDQGAYRGGANRVPVGSTFNSCLLASNTRTVSWACRASRR